jgi:hypothetical protein
LSNRRRRATTWDWISCPSSAAATRWSAIQSGQPTATAPLQFARTLPGTGLLLLQTVHPNNTTSRRSARC